MAKKLLPVLQCLIGVLIFTPVTPQALRAQESAPPLQASQSSQTQIAPPAPAKPLPGSIYKQVMHPLDVVRSSVDNWSEAELGALGVGIHKAHEGCTQANSQNYSGDDLYDLARLCSLGQDWKTANAAAQQYIAGGAETHRAQAYVISMNALVQLESVDAASQTALEMLHKLPYDAEVAYGLRYIKDYLERDGKWIAFTLADEEQYPLVQALRQNTPLKAAHGDAVISLGALYESGMQLAFFRRYAGDDDGAAETVAALDAAIATSQFIAEDQDRINTVRAQYKLLGTRLPDLNPIQSFFSASTKPRVDPNFGVATVLVLYPDWCTQCRKMMKTLTAFAITNGDVPIHAYGLMFSESPTDAAKLAQEQNADLNGTATQLVPASTAQLFAATEYPLGIVVDKGGLIRFVGTFPLDAFNGDGYVGKIITRMSNTAATCRKGDSRPTCQKPTSNQN